MDPDAQRTSIPENSTVTSPDIDRGWAYIVVTGAIVLYILGPGFTFSTGFLYVIFLEEFEHSATTTAWILTVNSLFTFGMGPVSSFLNNWLSIRQIITLGAVISSVGLIITSFAINLITAFIGFSVLAGVGWGTAYILAFDITAQYFVRKRPLMMTLITLGASLGQIIIPPIFLILIENYGWRGSLLIWAAVNLNFVVVAAIVMRPRGEWFDEQMIKFVPEDDTEKEAKPTFLRKLMSEVSTFSDPTFMLHSLGMALSSLTVGAFQTHISNYGKCLGFDEAQFTLLPSISGAVNTGARVIVAIVIQSGQISGTLLSIIGMLGIGAICVLCSVVRMFVGLSILSGLMGFTSGVWALIPQVVLELLAGNQLTTGCGQVLLFAAFGWVVGGPIAGLLYDVDPSYRSSFICVGIVQIVGAILYLPAYWRVKRRPTTSAFDVDL